MAESLNENTGREAAPREGNLEDANLFSRGREVLGDKSGGLIAKLKKAKGGNIALARATIEVASTKHNPAEYVAAILRNATNEAAEERERRNKFPIAR